jgi:hypothetical protein
VQGRYGLAKALWTFQRQFAFQVVLLLLGIGLVLGSGATQEKHEKDI